MIDSDSNTGSDEGEEASLPPPPKKKKQVTFADHEKPTEKILPASLPTPLDDRIDQMSKQLKELVLSYAKANWA
ncbi:hypothetical protein H0H87_000789 [Tephrocybe sp. NHM501043]|nr:hypothetical protein H0H87_000789 [Tephrocybe sp. NHM501043]